MTLSNTPTAMGAPVSTWLLPTTEDARIRLGEVVSQKADTQDQRVRPIRRLGAVARRALVDEIEIKLRTAMGETLADLVVDGWRTHAAVKLAIQKSQSQPGVDHIVPLHNHTITADREYDLDIEVDDVQVMTLSASASVRLQLYDAVAAARDGRLTAIRSGQAGADGTLTIEGVTIVHQRFTFPLTAELTFNNSWGMSAP